jgi:hypothetical protein
MRSFSVLESHLDLGFHFDRVAGLKRSEALNLFGHYDSPGRNCDTPQENAHRLRKA